MSGMNAFTGRALTGLPHIWQSVRDILTTPIGSRVQRRNYGSLIPELIDQPLNPATRLRIMSASITAVLQWEPRIRPSSAQFWLDEAGQPAVDLTCDRVDGARTSVPGTMSFPLRPAP